MGGRYLIHEERLAVREVVLGVIDLGLIAGLLWSLWFVVHVSRKRTERIGEQLAAPIRPTGDRVLIRNNRKEKAATTACWLVMASIAIGWTVDHQVAIGSVAIGSLAAALACAGLLVSGREVLWRGSVLAIDGNGMAITLWQGITLKSSQRSIPWDSVESVWLDERRGLYGISHYELVCQVDPHETSTVDLDRRATSTEEVTVPLEGLSMPWNDVVTAIQDRCGRRVPMIKH